MISTRPKAQNYFRWVAQPALRRAVRTLERAIMQEETLSKVPDTVFASVEDFSGRHDDDWTMLLVKRIRSDSQSAVR